MKIDHIGIAVKDIDQSNLLFQKLLGKEHYKIEEVETEGVLTSFFQTGESKVELVKSTRKGSAIDRFIEKKGEGIHHVAFEVEDIKFEMERLKAEGFQLLSDEPRKGADNKLVCFIHPKTANGVLVELCQSIDPNE
jgi:methylmalonyl-CoA/ethylmalonyl-CoA epimerase